MRGPWVIRRQCTTGPQSADGNPSWRVTLPLRVWGGHRLAETPHPVSLIATSPPWCRCWQLFCESGPSLREAAIVIESWRRHYNTVRPHASIGYRAPAPEGFVPALAAWPAAPPRPAPPAMLPLVPRPALN